MNETSTHPLRRVAIAALAILGVLSLFYGVSIFMIGTGSFFFLFWFVLGAGLILWGMAIARGWTRHIAKGLKVAFACALIAATAVFGVALNAVMQHVNDEPPAGVNYLIVLGAQVTENGPSNVLRLRLDAAASYLEANPDTICIVTGCQGPFEPWPEAYGMRDYLLDLGISPERIITEDQAEDTAQNIAYSRAFIPEGASVAIVSNNFHIYRALAIAEKQGLTEVYGLAAPMRTYYFLNNVAREAVCIVYYKLMGRI